MRQYALLTGKAAFTLVETLIASGILAIVMLGSMSLMTYSRIQNDLDQERARAHQIVTGQMERVKQMLYTQITGGTTLTVWDNGTPGNTADDTNGTISVQIRKLDGTVVTAAPVPAEAVQIEVTLTWNPRGRLKGKTFRETAMTYVAP
jgi:type II secretory pathway pseudopilin PulG